MHAESSYTGLIIFRPGIHRGSSGSWSEVFSPHLLLKHIHHRPVINLSRLMLQEHVCFPAKEKVSDTAAAFMLSVLLLIPNKRADSAH